MGRPVYQKRVWEQDHSNNCTYVHITPNNLLYSKTAQWDSIALICSVKHFIFSLFSRFTLPQNLYIYCIGLYREVITVGLSLLWYKIFDPMATRRNGMHNMG